MKTTAIVVLAFGLMASACQRPGQSARPDQATGVEAAPATGAAESARTATGGASARPNEAPTVAAGAAGLTSAAAAPKGPETREVTLASGTSLPIVLDTPVSSEGSQVGDEVRGHLAKPVLVDGETVLGTGTTVDGVVTAAERSGRVKGRAHVAIRFESLTGTGMSRLRIDASPYARTAAATKKKDALKVGAPAAGGAIIGAIAGGKKGALVGGAIGAGAGGAVVVSTRGDEVHLVRGTVVTVRLTDALHVSVPVH